MSIQSILNNIFNTRAIKKQKQADQLADLEQEIKRRKLKNQLEEGKREAYKLYKELEEINKGKKELARLK